MKELYNSIKGVFKSGGYSFLLLLAVLFFSADSVSIYFLILFGLVQLPLLFARDGSRHIISLLVFSISYALIWFMTGTISSIAILISICLCPSIFFLYGSKIGKNFDYSKELPIALLLLITIMLFNVYNATIRNVIEVGIVDPTRQLVFEGDESSSNATVWGLLVSPALGLLTVPLFVSKPIRRIWPVLYTIVSILAILTVVHVINRGGLIIATIAVFVSLFVRYKEKKFLLILAVVISVVAIVSIIPTSGDVFDAYNARSSAGDEGERIVRWQYGLGNLLKYPFGWNDDSLSHQYFMHNLWLDVARVSGIIPFLALVVATIRTFKNAYKLTMLSHSVTTIIIISIFITTFLSCFMEPALEAKQVAVYFFIFIWGIMDGVLQNKSFYDECNTNK